MRDLLEKLRQESTHPQVVKMRTLDEMDARGECYCFSHPGYLCSRHAERFREEYSRHVAAKRPGGPRFDVQEVLARIRLEG